MADQGASQRRGWGSQVTPIGQASALMPRGSQGESYSNTPAGSGNGKDTSFIAFDPVFNPNAGSGVGHDSGSALTRFKEERQFKVGLSTLPDGSPAGLYFEPALGQMTPVGGGGAAVVRYKLRARDDGALPTVSYVYWTSTSVDVGTYPFAPPFGGPLTKLTILARL